MALLAQTDRLLGVILFGNNLLNAGAATLAGVITARLIGTGELALAISTAVVTFLILVFSETTSRCCRKAIRCFTNRWTSAWRSSSPQSSQLISLSWQ